jgi:hypothetical protein
VNSQERKTKTNERFFFYLFATDFTSVTCILMIREFPARKTATRLMLACVLLVLEQDLLFFLSSGISTQRLNST